MHERVEKTLTEIRAYLEDLDADGRIDSSIPKRGPVVDSYKCSNESSGFIQRHGIC